jgi:hypothetical protein
MELLTFRSYNYICIMYHMFIFVLQVYDNLLVVLTPVFGFGSPL